MRGLIYGCRKEGIGVYVANTAGTNGLWAQAPEELKKELGKDDFLLLMLTELSYQDPLNPVDNQDFIAQLAQFSSLEQMYNVAKSLDTLAQYQLQAGSMAQATALIGREVTIAQLDGDPISGTVERVKIVDGLPQLLVDGKLYPIGLVLEVA
ncbi:MAG: hypothetical protein GX058_05390 [Firmicutes bacterium]|nr:hypothetical protein [Bacillota bacterium]